MTVVVVNGHRRHDEGVTLMRIRHPSAQPGEWRRQRDRPRVLIENHDPALGMAYQRILVEEGFEVSYCEGPSERGGWCPLASNGSCDRAADADVVFSGLRLSDECDREVLASLRSHFPGKPVVVEVSSQNAERYSDELEGCETIAKPVTRSRLVMAIRRALAQRDGDVSPPLTSGDVVR